MQKNASFAELTFAQACEYLALSPDDLTALREAGFIACIKRQGRQVYPKDALDITQHLLHLATRQFWKQETLAWFADLSFAASIGRTLLLPIDISNNSKAHLSTSWLEIPNLSRVLTDFNTTLHGLDESFNNLLRAVVAVGNGHFWPDLETFQTSALYPLITHLEEKNIPILDQGESIARDASPILVGLIMTFTHMAPPVSPELAGLIQTVQARFSGSTSLLSTVSANDESSIKNDKLVAVDKLYAKLVPQIHSKINSEEWQRNEKVIVVQRPSIKLVARLPLDQDQEIIDNIIDLITPYIGPFGRRVIHLLYEIANDPPNWRNPLITINPNDLLDRLGMKRDANGYHRSNNRERLRDTLNFAHYLEIVGEAVEYENGQRITRAFQRTVLSVIGATFEENERANIATEDLFQRGLPRTMVIRLNFYDGVRRPDGRLGNHYVLMNRLGNAEKLPQANHAATHEALRAYLQFRYRELGGKTRIIPITRQNALDKANIKNKNVSMATATLRKALDKLVAEGILEGYSEYIPTKPHQSFEIIISEDAVLKG